MLSNAVQLLRVTSVTYTIHMYRRIIYNNMYKDYYYKSSAVCTMVSITNKKLNVVVPARQMRRE